LSARRLIFVFLVAAAAGVALLPIPVAPGDSIDPAVMPALALTVFTVGMWATGAMPEHYASVVFFILALVFQIAPVEVIFSGLKSSAFWLIAGGMVIGVSADRTGLGRYLAHAFVRRLNKSYLQLITGIVIGAVALAFLIPAAIARLIILMPIILGLADQLGFKSGDKGRTGMVLATTFACFFIPLAILPANLPNVVLAGVAESLYGLKITYGFYLLMQFPVSGALKGVLLIAIIHFLFRQPIPNPGQSAGPPPTLSVEGKRLAVIVGVTLCIWATDFIHGIAPGWVAIGTAIVCVMPGLGVVRPVDFRQTKGFQTLFFVAAVLALGSVVASSGAGSLITDGLLALNEFRPGHPANTYWAFSAIGMMISLFATLPGAIVVLAPFANDVAAAAGLPVMSILMVMVNGFSTVFFPYQSAPLLVGIRLGSVTLIDGLKVCLPLAILTVIVLLPLNYLWWTWLGHLK